MGKKIPARVKQSVRYVALRTIERVDSGGAYSNLLLNEMINHSALNEKDSRLFTELVYGTISRKLLIEFYLQPFIQNPKKVDSWVKNLLNLSIYQLVFLDKIPDHAIINEAVEIGKHRGNIGIARFVNGVLRAFQREGAPSLEKINDPIERLSIEISMPLWLTNKLIKQIGIEETRKLGVSLFDRSHASARIDTRVLSREEATEELRVDGIEAVPSDISPYGIVAKKGFLAGSYLFDSGKLTIQDESSMLVAPALQLEKNHVVLDACAAPGGKTTHIATYLDASIGGRVKALDIHEHKIKLIKQNAKRLHVEAVVDTEKLDARQVKNEFPANYFDRILVDAPCSGLGLMRRKPDIKYNKSAQDFEQLPIIQLDILANVVDTLKPGGILVYSTCTILEEENQRVIEAFLTAHSDFEKIDSTMNACLRDAITDQMITLYPHQFGTDGFFICCMQKKR